MKGKIIAIEGNDGVGKQTQSKLLVDALNNIGIKTELLSFPNYNSDSSSIVKMYLNGELGSINDITPNQHSTIYAMDRFATIKKEKIIDKLIDGTWFVMDRYILSNIIYTLAKLDYSNDQLLQISDFTKVPRDIKFLINNVLDLEYSLGIPAPNINFILNLSSEFSDKLRNDRKNKIDNSNSKDIHESNEEYLKKVNSMINIIQKFDFMHYGLDNNQFKNISIKCDNGKEILSKEEIHKMIIRKLIENGVK